MNSRCNNPKVDQYRYYGGKGIRVCERWKSFENFVADMGLRPAGKTLDRRDGAKDYEPENCRWATKLEQAENRSMAIVLEFEGKKMILAQWAREKGIKYATLLNRIRSGWSVEKALTI
jgi:hypothetical protein